MNTTNTISTRVLAILFVAALGAGAATDAVADSPAPADGATTRCAWTPDLLPRSPDAIEGWYRGCPPSGTPHSPTAVEAWGD